MSMGAPSITIAFIEQAAATIQRSDRGIIAMIMVDDSVSALTEYVVLTTTDIPTTLSDANQTQLLLTLMGYQNTPKKIIVEVIPSATSTTYNAALEALGTQKWNYLVAPSASTDSMVETLATWIKTQRSTYHRTFKAVLPGSASDDEGIINFDSTAVYGSTTLTAEQLCGRIAGIIAGTPMTMSCTYAPLNEMSDCSRLTPSALDAAVAAGKLVLMWDGEKVKLCRGVNSLTTTTSTKGESFQKIRLVDIMDMIQDDIRMTAEDSYIGKYNNTYDNKCLLISAVNGYFMTIAREGALKAGHCEINMEQNYIYVQSEGGTLLTDEGEQITLADATEQQIKEANTGSHVYLKCNISMLDAIEDIDFEIYI